MPKSWSANAEGTIEPPNEKVGLVVGRNVLKLRAVHVLKLLEEARPM